jgi:putative inorganic carbon (hco3(-)) transporter
MAVAGSLALLAAGWTAFVAAAAADRLPHHVPATAMLAFATLVAVGLGTSRWRDRADARWAAGWLVLVPAAVVAAHVVTDRPTLIAAAPVLLVCALVAGRAPAANVLVGLATTGFFGTLSAYTSIPGGKLIDVLLLGLWLAIAWHMLFAERIERIVLPPGVVCLLALGAIGLAQVALASDTGFALRALRSSTFLVLALLAVALVARDGRTAKMIARGILLVGLAVAAYAVLRHITGPTHKELVLAQQQPYNHNNGALRLIGSLLSRHQLAVWLGAIVPFCIAAAAPAGKRVRIATGALCALSAVAILATNSRGGFLAAIVGMAAVVLLLNAAPAFPSFRMGTSALIALVVVVAGSLAMTFTVASSDRHHFENILHPGRDQAYQARQVKWREAEDSIVKHPWGLGLGEGSGLSLTARNENLVGAHDIDNSYLTLAYEQGWAAILLFVAGLILLAARLIVHVRGTRDAVSAGLAAGGCAVLLSFAAAMYGGNYLIGTTALVPWIVVGVGVSRVIAMPDAGRRHADR